MIDLHCHILPGLDDGAATIDDSIALAKAAEAAGIEVIVATPHIREDFPFDPALIEVRVAEVQDALAAGGVQVQVVAGAEVAISHVRDLGAEVLRTLCLGDGAYMLVETPYTHATNMLEDTIFDLQVQGFRVVLAHPERCPSFQQEPGRLAQLVERGVYCSVTAASMMGVFGGTVRRFTASMFDRGLVHNVASDAHDTKRRPVDLRRGFAALDGEVPGLAARAQWFTAGVPKAMMAGTELPPAPAAPAARRRGLFSGRRGQ